MRGPVPVLLGNIVLLAMAGCGGASSSPAASSPAASSPAASSPATSLPTAGASASVVLDAYLHALVAGDCTTAHALASSTFSTGNGELCGDVTVSAFARRGAAATPRGGEVVYPVVLTTGGSADGTVSPGKTLWFYDLKRQDGEWRLAGGGSGP